MFSYTDLDTNNWNIDKVPNFTDTFSHILLLINSYKYFVMRQFPAMLNELDWKGLQYDRCC